MFLQIGGFQVDDYVEIINMLELIKGNSKAIEYIKGFLKIFIERYC